MAATVKVQEKNGAGETATDKSSGTIRFKNADDATVDLNDPLVVPTSNREYSYEKWLRFNIASGTFTQITNIIAYTDGSNGFGTGINLWYAADSAYSTPVIPTETNDPPEHDAVAMADAFGLTVGSPLTLGAGPYDSTGLPKDVGDYLVLVMEVETNAGQGTTPTETLTISYDEV